VRIDRLLIFVTLLVVFSYQTPSAIEIKGGRLEDVVVVAGGISDSTFVTEFIDGWFARGPNSFDVDKDGNVYILDWLGEKVVKFDKEGKWVLSFRVPSAPGFPGTRSVGGIPNLPQEQRPRSDIAVDNSGNVYVTTGNTLKFSVDGALLFRLHSATLHLITVDKDGRFYNFRGKPAGMVDIYTPKGEEKATIYDDFEYPDRVVAQKEVGNDIYFRVNKYLMKTTLEDFLQTSKLDTAAVLPTMFRLFEYYDELVREVGPLPSPFTLIGFDKDNCFYFHRPGYWYAYKWERFCQTNLIYKMRLQNGEFQTAGTVNIYFLKGKDGECSDKGLWDFTERKQFIVSGDGTIYFLHGTVDTVKVSKIIVD